MLTDNKNELANFSRVVRELSITSQRIHEEIDTLINQEEDSPTPILDLVLLKKECDELQELLNRVINEKNTLFIRHISLSTKLKL